MKLGLDREIRRLLAVRLDNIGDVVMLGPALRVLRNAFPQAHLTLLASRAGAQVAPLLPWIDEVWEHRAVWQDASAAMPLDPEREMAFVSQLREHQFDAALIFTSFSQSSYPPAFACYLAGIPIRIAQSKEFGGSVLSQWVRALPGDAHQVDRNLFLLKSAGLEFDEEAEKCLELRVPEKIQATADERLREAGIAPESPFLLLAPGASCPARMYDARRFASAAALISAELHLPMVLLGSAREERFLGPLLEAADGAPVASLVGKTTVAEMCGVIRRAVFLLGVDSGPMHIADAFQCPMVILFSGTEYESQWRPRNSPALLLRRPTPCSPCYLFECRYQMECLDIPPAEVAQQAVRFYRQIAGRGA